jgi:pimeloyl-ACP methyl ester carboxylesterase
MAKIVFVHGMRMQHYDGRVLHARWYQALLRGLKETAYGREHPEWLPRKTDVELVYWGDFFRPESPRREVASKGVSANLEALKAAYYALLRGAVRAADVLSLWDAEGRPRSAVARLVNHLVYQSAVYMNNGAVHNADPRHEPGAYFQIQARVDAAIKDDTRLVVAHSLGTVIAYEGLCRNPHRVDTLITVGSPIATPQLILQPLKERLHRVLNHAPELPPPWPGVRRWLNFYAPADVWSVPVKRLAPIFDSHIRDLEVTHGNPHDFVRTHKLTTYLKHAEIQEEIARTLEEAAARDTAEEAAKDATTLATPAKVSV